MALLAAYSFDEASGDVLDCSGNGRHWALNNNAVRVAGGHTGSGLGKNGVGMPVVASLAFGQTTARTFMFWQQNTGDAVWWLRWWTSSGDTGTWGLYNTGSLILRCRKGGVNTNTVATTPSSGWHHYAGTYDGTNARLYVDGALVGTSAAVSAPLDTAERIDLAEGTLANFVMDDLRIYDEALDQPTIATLMDTPVTADEPPHAEGTVTLAASAGITAAGSRTAPGSVVLGATAGMALSGLRESVGAAVLPATAGLVVSGARSSVGTARLAAVASLPCSGRSHRAGSVTLTASAAVRVGRVGRPGQITTPASRTAITPAESRVAVT